MTLVQDFTSGYAVQSFPATTAALTAIFPTATSPLMYLCNDAATSGVLAEAQGGAAFNAQGGPKFGLTTPFASNKSAVAVVDASSQLQNSSTTAFDPANGSLTILIAFRVEHVRPGNAAIIAKNATAGYTIYLDTTDHINVLYSDGTHSSTLTTGNADYGQGAYHLIAVTFNAAGSVTIYTDEETVTQTVPNGFTWSAFTNTSAATLGNAASNADPLFGCVAYIACFAGTITQPQYNAWVTYGTTSGFAGLTYTAATGIGIGTYDLRDPLNPRVRKHGRAQMPIGSLGGNLAVALLQPVSNYLLQPEEFNGTNWTTNGTGLYVYPHQGPDPGYGYNACTLLKDAAGTTPSRRQSPAAIIGTGYFVASIWLRASDSKPHLAALQCTFGGDGGGQVVTSTVTVTGTWQLVSVSSNLISYVSGTSPVFDVFPADPSNPSATGSVQAWGAQITILNTPDAVPPIYTLSTPAIGKLAGTGATFNTSNGYIRCVYVPGASKSTGSMPLVGIAQSGAQGGVQLYYNSAVRYLNAVIVDSTGTQQFNSPFWDLRTVSARGKRTDAVMSWDFLQSTRQGGSTGRVRLAIDGSAPGGLVEDPASPPAWPAAGIAGSYTIGFDSISGTLPGVYVERVEFGPAPGTISRASSKATTEGYYGNKLLRIGCFGDSITAFQDGHHALLSLLLGRDVTVAVNYGLSGNRISGLGGLVQTLFPGTVQSRFQYDFLAGQFDEVILFAGINEILFDSETDATAIGRLTDLINMFANAGVVVRVNTLTPARNNTFSNWTTTKGQYIINYNAAIKAGLPNVASVCDLYSFFDDGTGQYRGGVGGLLSYDGLHPTHGISGNNGPGADAQALLEFAQHYKNQPYRSTANPPAVNSYSVSHGVAGASVVIGGSGFDATTCMVDFNGIPATSFTVNSPTQITATVPTIITSGPIGVATANGRAFGQVFNTP